MRFLSTTSLLLSLTAVACGGDDFSPSTAGGAGASAAGGSAAGGSAAGGSAAGGSAAGAAGTVSAGGKGGSAGSAQGGTSNGGNGGATAGGAAGSPMGKSCDTGADCGKANACTGVPSCSNHSCFLDTSEAPNIEDSNACTEDTCNPLNGAVTHTVIPLGDGNPCTKDTCDPVAGIAHTVDPKCTGCETNAQCDDGNPCTEDLCATAKCSHAPKAQGSQCGDGDACVGKSLCDDAGKCVPTTVNDPDDKDACTVDTCDPKTGKAINLPLSADDGDACTVDTCDPGQGIVHIRAATDDKNACTVDSCDPKMGVLHMPVPLGDGDPCTTDSCDPLTGPKYTLNSSCDGTCKTNEACADGNPCTKDLCTNGKCENPSDDGAACEDGLFCTAGDKCAAGACVGGNLAVEDDNNLCTIDDCNEAKNGFLHIPKDVTVGGTACTQDSCDTATGEILHTRKALCCLTDDECVKIEPGSGVGVCRKAGGKCEANACVKNPDTPIDDGKACTTDVCDAATGLVTHAVVVKPTACCLSNADCPGGARDGRCFAPGSCNADTKACTYNTDGAQISDGKECTADQCDGNTGNVTHALASPSEACCTTASDCLPSPATDNECFAPSTCESGVCKPGAAEPRPEADTKCTKYVCRSDGKWEGCCLAAGPAFGCDQCLEPVLGSACSSIK